MCAEFWCRKLLIQKLFPKNDKSDGIAKHETYWHRKFESWQNENFHQKRGFIKTFFVQGM